MKYYNEAIIKLSSLGDIIHSLVVLPILNKKVSFIVDSSFKEILEHNPYIEKIIDLDIRNIKKNKKLIFKEIKKIKNLNFEKVYDLQGLLKSALISRFISKNVIGYKNPREKIASFFYNEKINTTKNIAIERYLDLFNIENKEFLKNHPKLLFYKDKKFDFLSKTKKNIIFIIGATWECKKLPISKWIELANNLKNENIIIPYTKNEEKEAKEIANNADVKIVKLSLNDLKALISKSDLLIGNDTGPSFIAWANNINNIILYGCTYNNKIIENKFSKSIEIQKTITKGLIVMDKIKVNDILRKIDEF